MPDLALAHSNSNSGTATPATPGSITATAGNLLLCLIGAIGTSPTIATPTSAGTWTVVQNQGGAVLVFSLFMQANTAGGAINPSSVLGGTVTGWLAVILEFSQAGANCSAQGSNQQNLGVAQLTNIFPTSGQTLYNELFIYSVLRQTATITPQNSWNVANVSWSSSIQPQAGVNGLSLDTFWASGLGQGVGQYPQASGLLSGAVASRQIGAWFNTIASQSSNNDNVNGQAGVFVPQQYAGLFGG